MRRSRPIEAKDISVGDYVAHGRRWLLVEDTRQVGRSLFNKNAPEFISLTLSSAERKFKTVIAIPENRIVLIKR